MLYALFWLGFFEFARIYFLIVQHKEASEYHFITILQTFTHGFRLDLSATCYILLLPLLLSVAWTFVSGGWFKRFLKIYSFLIIVLLSGLVIADARIYSFWAFRLEFSVIFGSRGSDDIP